MNIHPTGLQPQSVSIDPPMPDVIDSLKRLERIGSENSKTTEKLMDAAREIERVIVKAFAPETADEVIQVVIPPKDRWSDANEKGICIPLPNPGRVVRKYWIENCALQFRSSGSGANGTSVSKNRTTALEFSEDIAKGLLDYVNEALAQHKAKTEEASSVLTDVIAKLKQ